MPHFTSVRAACLLGVALLLPAGMAAQEEDDRFDLRSEAGASVFFGATSQTTVTFNTFTEYRGPRWNPSGRFTYDYGEAQDDAGVVSVNKRSWLAEGKVAYHTGGAIDPFAFATLESALERQIELRYSVGAGALWTPLDRDDKRFALGAGLKYEGTDPRPANGDIAERQEFGRYYALAEAKWPVVPGKIDFAWFSTYQPEIGDFNNFTVEIDTGLTFAVSELLALKLSLVDRYDSLAKERGALSDNDGRLYFSVVANLR